ncbi:MAG: sigma-70 family RNA polymerase sigma factor [Myxococcales bacterium]|nr:sigma-70 family RNA polymerase sigma factor [Myxococcota bacterium]MDW8281420.1 sigma-70 family RNA polymerase sigma factor [Myxococcales bacterium]
MGDSAPTTVPQRNLAVAQAVGPLSLKEERLLARRWRESADPRAIEALVHAHLGLVVRIASEFRHAGPSLEDLVQEGNVGLTIAARRFDPNRSTRLATYASYWIRACMMEHVVRSHGPVRIGTTRAQRKIFFGLGRARRKLEAGGRPANMAELAAELGVDVAEVEAMTPRLSQRDVHLDAARSDEDQRPLSDQLAHDHPSPEDQCTAREEALQRRTRFAQALRKLEPRERDILTSRHLRERPETLAQLGKRFGLSRERVRQLEARAKQRLRELCGAPPNQDLPASAIAPR